MPLALQPPLAPMLARLARSLPEPPGWWYEPKWDGFRCVVFRDGDDITLTSRNERPFNRYFPELLPALAAALPDRIVVDGEIVIPHPAGGLDFDALLSRLHPAASRVALLAEQIPASFVAFDLLVLGDDLLMDEPFERRRTLLRAALTPGLAVHLTPAVTDVAVAEDWFHRFEGAGLDGVVAKRATDPYQPGKRGWVKVKHERRGHALAVGYRLHKDGVGVGSLVLGLFDDDGMLHHVGVAAGFSAAKRRALLDELAPLSASEPAEAPPGATSRWNVGKDLSYLPLQQPRVAEITFGQLQAGRFRHGVTFVAWRNDRHPQDCRISQLEVAEPVPFLHLVGRPPP